MSRGAPWTRAPQRTRHLHQVHHARRASGRAGTRCSQIREEVSFTKGRIIVRGKLVTPRQGQARRLHPLLQAEHPDRRSSRRRTTPTASATACSRRSTTPRPSTSRSSSPRTATASSSTTAPAAARELESDAGARRISRRPADLWARYRAWKGLTPEAEAIVLQDYYDDGSGKAPRYYQRNAINAAIEAIAKGQDRILLVMATGTGKTYTAFQIIWRLWKAGPQEAHPLPRRPQRPRRPDDGQRLPAVRRGDGEAQHRVQDHRARRRHRRSSCTTALDKQRRIDTAYEIYLGLYQAITGPEERQKLFREFSPGFFDLIVDRRVPPRQRGRGFGLARDPRVLLRRHADRHDRHAEGDRVRLQHPLLRRAGLHLLAASRASATASSRPTRSSRSTSTGTSRATGPRRASSTATATRSRTASTTRRTSTARWSSTTAPSSSPRRSPSSSRRAATASRRPSSSASTRSTPPACGRRSINENADLVRREPPLRHAHHRRRRRRPGAARQLHRPGGEVPGHRHHLAPALDRRRCPDLPPDRPRPRGRLDDRVQADRRPRHPRPRGHARSSTSR